MIKLHSDIDYNRISFGSECKIYNHSISLIRYNKQKLYVQTPNLYMPFMIDSRYKKKYASFLDTSDGQSFNSFLSKLDKACKSRASSRKPYTPILSENNDIIRVTLHPKCSIFDHKKKEKPLTYLKAGCFVKLLLHIKHVSFRNIDQLDIGAESLRNQLNIRSRCVIELVQACVLPSLSLSDGCLIVDNGDVNCPLCKQRICTSTYDFTKYTIFYSVVNY